jgi:hypothetical protein
MIIITIIIAIATGRPRLHGHQSDAPQYIKTLDSTGTDKSSDHMLQHKFWSGTFYNLGSFQIKNEFLLVFVSYHEHQLTVIYTCYAKM